MNHTETTHYGVGIPELAPTQRGIREPSSRRGFVRSALMGIGAGAATTLVTAQSASAASTLPLTGSDVRLDRTATKTLTLDDGNGQAATLAILGPIASTRGAAQVALTVKIAGDTQDRFVIRSGGKNEWGDGAGVRDVALYRSGPGTLVIDNNAGASGHLRLGRLGVSDDGSNGFGDSPSSDAVLRTRVGSLSSPRTTLGGVWSAKTVQRLKVVKKYTVDLVAGSTTATITSRLGGTVRGIQFGVDSGRPISGVGIPMGTVVSNQSDSDVTIVLSQPASATGSAVTATIGDLATDAAHQYVIEGSNALYAAQRDADGNQAQLNAVVGYALGEYATSWDVVGGVFIGETGGSNSRLATGLYAEGRSATNAQGIHGVTNGAEISITNLTTKTWPWNPVGHDGMVGVWVTTAGADGTTAIGVSSRDQSRWKVGIGFKENAFAADATGVGIRFAAPSAGAAAVLQVDGGTWSYGVDLGTTTSYSNGRAIRVPNTDGIVSRNGQNSGDVAVVMVTSSNRVYFGTDPAFTLQRPTGYHAFMTTMGVSSSPDGVSFCLRSISAVATDVGSTLGLAGTTDSAQGHAANFGVIRGAKANGTVGDTSGYLSFHTNDGVNGMREAMRLTPGADVQLAEATDVVLGQSSGTRLGTSPVQRLGFWNAAPTTQPTAVLDVSGGSTIDTEARATVNAVLARLRAIGLIAT